MTIIKALRIALFAMLVALAGRPAFAASIDLHPFLCLQGRADERAQVAHGAYRIPACMPPAAATGWVVLHLRTAEGLAGLPADWRLLLDENRFDRIVVTATSRDGAVQRFEHDENGIGSHWAPGNALSFPIRFPGRDVAHLTVAFWHLDGPMFIRKVVAMDPESERLRGDRWLLLMGLFAGAVVSALIYNIVIYLGQRHSFQRWYIAWAVSVLCYGAWWTGLLGFVSDLLVGPRAVRGAGLWLGFVVASGAMFLIDLIEPTTIRRPYVLAGRVIAAMTLVAAALAATDWLVPAVPADNVLNAALVLNTLWVISTVTSAARRGSRIVWFYLAGWLPVLSVFILRLARNLGWLPQDDLVDMATFAAIALESIVLSVTISYRFRHLKRDRDAAESAMAAMTIEAETLRRAAQTDFLTQLGNRAAFHSALYTLEPHAALFLIDVDHLKEINDSFGHQHGDALLVHVADRLRAHGAEAIVIARMGGDEFAIALPAGREDAMADALDAMQGEQWTYAGRSHSLSLSIGYARCGQICDPTIIYQHADFALYQAKRLGRGRRHRYDPEAAGLLDLEASLANEAPRALAKGEFVLHYQPIVDLGDGRQIGAEALLRWQHPTAGLLTPHVFGSLFSDEALGPLIQEQVLAIAIQEMAATSDASLGYLSVNFTGSQLRGKAAALHILDRLDRANVPPHKLCVEVTEGVFLDRKGNDVVEALYVLHSAGVRIALDDFGTGYASLVHLQRIPVDMLKIDRSFIARLEAADQQTREIVRSILSLSQALQKEVVAEGIETEAQRRQLLDFGCRLGQGYLFARPGPAVCPLAVETRNKAA